MRALNKIVFINRYFLPDHSATSQMLSDLAFHLAANGRNVHVVTSRQTYDDPVADLPPRATEEGVEIHRVRTSRRGRGSLAGRALDYGAFYATAFTKCMSLLRKGDIVVAKTDPPLLSAAIAPAAKLRGARLINWLQDLYPEIALALGVSGPPGTMRAARFARDRSLKAAAINVAISEGMEARLAGLGIPPRSLRAIHNWADDATIRPIPPDANPLRREWGLGGTFVVGYSGNLGRAHEIETVLGAAQQLADRADIRFLFVGGGHLRPELERQAAKRGLANLVFKPYQPRADLAVSLSVADVHWLSLRPELDGLVVPSKLYGIAAAGRPMVVVSGATGEIGRIVMDAGCGVGVDAGDATGFASALLRLYEDAEARRRMGERARAIATGPYSKDEAMRRWDAILDGLAIGGND